MRVPLKSYLTSNARVFSLVAKIPFAPVDFDLGKLSRGEWNPLTDRFRLWYLPGSDNEAPTVYVMVRKFDEQDGILIYGHVVVNISEEGGHSFTLGVLCNDDVKARSFLNSVLDIPPSFHRRTEITVVESKWRSEPDVVMRYLANVHSAVASLVPAGEVERHTLEFTPPPRMVQDLKRGLSSWWTPAEAAKE